MTVQSKPSNSINLDLSHINLQYLMVAREYSRINPIEAIWKFNLTQHQIDKIISMSVEDMQKLAECGRAVFTIDPNSASKPGVPTAVATVLSI